jgi:hypothetical protein
MDERLAKALEISNLRFTQSLERQRLKEKLKNDLLFAHNGGQFYIDRAFIAFLGAITPQIGNSETVLLDDRENPVLIKDLSEFTKTVMNQYFAVTNQYLLELTALRQKRSVQSIVGL